MAIEIDWYMEIGDACTDRETGKHAVVLGREVTYGERWTHELKPPTKRHIGTWDQQKFLIKYNDGSGLNRLQREELLRYGRLYDE